MGAAKLQGTQLGGASLFGADLRFSSIQDASLIDARLRNADLRGAKIEGANLSGTDLGATLGLIQDMLDGACGNHGTTLPGGLTVRPCPDVEQDADGPAVAEATDAGG